MAQCGTTGNQCTFSQESRANIFMSLEKPTKKSVKLKKTLILYHPKKIKNNFMITRESHLALHDIAQELKVRPTTLCQWFLNEGIRNYEAHKFLKSSVILKKIVSK